MVYVIQGVGSWRPIQHKVHRTLSFHCNNCSYFPLPCKFQTSSCKYKSKSLKLPTTSQNSGCCTHVHCSTSSNTVFTLHNTYVDMQILHFSHLSSSRKTQLSAGSICLQQVKISFMSVVSSVNGLPWPTHVDIKSPFMWPYVHIWTH